MRITPPRHVYLPALFVLLSCTDPSGPGTPTNIALVSGGGQSDVVAAVLAQPVVVEVKDADGRPVRGVSVAWSITAGNGSVSAATTTTNGSGRSQAVWTLGTVAGENRISVGVTGVAPTTVIAMGEAGTPASVAVLRGDSQIGMTSALLGDGIAVRVRDAYGNGVAGASVTFVPAAGTVTPSVVVTNPSGAATAAWTLGPDAGQQTADATVPGMATPTRFTATALALDQVTELLNNDPVGPISAAQGESRYLRIAVPAGVTRLVVTTTGGPGDVDLFVRLGTLPTFQRNACRSITHTANESCTILAPPEGQWFVLLDAYTAYSDVTIQAAYVIGGSMAVGVTGLPEERQASVSVTGPGGYGRLVGSPTTLELLDPGLYTVTADFVQYGDTVYVVTPEVQQVEVTEGVSADVAVAYSESTGGLNLDINRAYITQAVQRSDGSIPLVAGRDGLLRVFARSNAANDARPTVRARFYQNGDLVETLTTTGTATSVPIRHDESSLSSTWNITVPGALIQPGVSVLVDVDPENEITETDESDNSFPASGTPLALDVRSAPPFRARLVPVTQSNGLQGDVTEANKDDYTTLAHALYPLPSIDADVRAPYSFSGVLPSQYDSIWSRLLTEIRTLRVTDSSDRYYYGVVKPAYTTGGTGLGFIGLAAAVGVDFPNWRAETAAHEWGHNFERFHVACGGPSNPDLNYPYNNGRIGHHGYDIRTNVIRGLDSHYDLMSYCQPTWSSDYTYEAVMDFRATEAAGGAAAEPSLLVWGRISPDGAVLEPSFEVVARPMRPGKTGRYRLTGRNSAGGTVLDIAFDGHEIDHMPGVRAFAYTIPLRSMGGSAPVEIRLHGAGLDEVRTRATVAVAAGDVQAERIDASRVRLRWDAGRNPVLMVRDGRTGEVLSFARGGDAHVTTSAAEVEVNMSDGVRSTMRRIVVSR